MRQQRQGARRYGLHLGIAASLACASLLGAQVSAIAAAAPTLSSVAAWNVPTESSARAVANSVSLLVTGGATQMISWVTQDELNPFPQPVRLTTQWQLNGLVTTVDLVGFFTSPGAALSSEGAHIPAARIEGRMVSGLVSAFTPFTQGPVGGQGVPGATLHLYRQSIVATVNGTGQRTDQLDLRLNLRGATRVPSGTYRGTLTLRATAY